VGTGEEFPSGVYMRMAISDSVGLSFAEEYGNGRGDRDL